LADRGFELLLFSAATDRQLQLAADRLLRDEARKVVDLLDLANVRLGDNVTGLQPALCAGLSGVIEATGAPVGWLGSRPRFLAIDGVML